jgi:hypothetical protein
MKFGDVYINRDKSLYRIIGKQTQNFFGEEAYEMFYASGISIVFRQGVNLGEQDYMRNGYTKIDINNLPSTIKQAYVKWKLDQL